MNEEIFKSLYEFERKLSPEQIAEYRKALTPLIYELGWLRGKLDSIAATVQTSKDNEVIYYICENANCCKHKNCRHSIRHVESSVCSISCEIVGGIGGSVCIPVEVK